MTCRQFGRTIALLFAAAGPLSAGPAWAFQDEGTVRIGSLEAQTGVPAPYGIQGLNGSKIAIDEINAAGGVMVDGKRVKLALTPAPNGYDPGADSEQTLALMRKLIADDKVLAIKGTSRSQNTEVAFNYLKELEKEGTPIVLLSSASASPGLGGITKWGFRNSFFEGKLIGRELDILKSNLGYKTAALFVVQDNQFTVAMAQGVIAPALKRHGLDLVATVQGLEHDTDLSRQVAELRRANPDVVFVSSSVLPGVNLMKEAARRGFRPKIWVGTVGSIAPEVPELGGRAIERMIVGSSFSPANPAIHALQDTYHKRYGTEISLFGVNGYEAIYLFKDAIEHSGIANRPETLQQDRAKFRDALASAKITSVTGETVSFDANGDAVKSGFILTVKNGHYVDWDGKAF